ncbi:hypothetical protein D3C75_1264780 [compost metagenome]
MSTDEFQAEHLNTRFLPFVEPVIYDSRRKFVLAVECCFTPDFDAVSYLKDYLYEAES